MTDWADELAQRVLVSMRYRSIKDEHWDTLCNQVAGAFRNTKAEGMRELADEMTAHQQQIRRHADKIERGEV